MCRQNPTRDQPVTPLHQGRSHFSKPLRLLEMHCIYSSKPLRLFTKYKQAGHTFLIWRLSLLKYDSHSKQKVLLYMYMYMYMQASPAGYQVPGLRQIFMGNGAIHEYKAAAMCGQLGGFQQCSGRPSGTIKRKMEKTFRM